MSDILIIDNDDEYGRQLHEGLAAHDFKVECVNCLHVGLGKLARGNFQVVILDESSASSGIVDALHHLRGAASSPEVIILSWRGDPDAAEASIRAGAWNYFSRPISLLRLKVVVERIFGTRQRKEETCTVALKREGIVGNARPLQTCLDEVAHAAATEANTLITGETGTGKELFARAIHVNSRRSKGKFVVVDCAALPETLAESMLFGHEKGAFTSADVRAGGLVREADNGTLFLDEIGELPSSVQKVFLRVLEHRRFRPVGSTKEITSNFRLVAATNRNLDRMVKKRTFRRDLLYRLRAMSIELPPLRAITEDMNEMTCYYIGKITARMNTSRKGFSPDFLDALMNYDWPGNVRELVNGLERAISMAGDEPVLFPRHLPTSIRAQMARSSAVRSGPYLPPAQTAKTAKTIHAPPASASRASNAAHPPQQAPPADLPLPPLKDFRADHLQKIEKMYLEDLLGQCRGDMQKCLTLSGLSRARFYALLHAHGLKRE